MRASIEKGKIVLPREIVQKLNLPENGECEVVVEEDAIKLSIAREAPMAWVEFLREPPIESSVEEFTSAEIVDED